MGGIALDFSKSQPLPGNNGGVTLDFSKARPWSITDNPGGEGVYKMVGDDGKIVGVPYSNVPQAQASRYKFTTPEMHDKWRKDYEYEISKSPMGEVDKFDSEISPDPGMSAGEAGMRRAAQGVASIGLHPVNTALGVYDLLKAGVDSVGAGSAGFTDQGMNERVADSPVTQRAAEFQRDRQQGGNGYAYGKAAGDVAGMVIGGKFVEGLPELRNIGPATRQAVGGVADAAARTVAGGELDKPMPGEMVTPREQYEIARGQGVQPDLAQATGGKVAGAVKKLTEHSLPASGDYENLHAQNLEALQTHVQDLLDGADPQGMTREEFGNAAKNELLTAQERQNAQAGEIFKELSKDGQKIQPKMGGIRDLANKLIDDNSGYYLKHPELLRGGAARAWGILQDLATERQAKPDISTPTGVLDASGQPIMRVTPGAKPVADTWTDLHRLRSDLMDLYRSPEIVGTRSEGWLKQMTGAVDQTMTGAASGLSPESLAKFRMANQIYGNMKEVFDSPQSTLYHVVRAPDGLTAANWLATAKPEVTRYVGQNAPKLVPQMQRQAMARIFSPAGNELADLRTLPSRFTRAQKEQMGAMLTTKQLEQIENVARTTRQLNFDSNPSGTAKKGQVVIEGAGLGGGLLHAGMGVLHGDLGAVGEGLVPLVAAGAEKVAGRAMTSPAVVERVMRTPTKGPKAWQAAGAQRLAQAGVSPEAIDGLKSTPQGQQTLAHAGSVSINSKAMRAILARLGAQKRRDE